MFNRLINPNAIVWNTTLRGHAADGRHVDVLSLFRVMLQRNVAPDKYTLPVVLKSCASIPAPGFGQLLHCFAIKMGFMCNGFVGTTLLEMYSTAAKDLCLARNMFNEMSLTNVVAWTAIVRAYLSFGDVKSARLMFDQASERDTVLWNVMVSGYVDSGDMAAARELFCQLPECKRDVMSWNTLLLGYAEYGDNKACEEVFKKMPERNVFSWNGLISGYYRGGNYLEVLDTFTSMLRIPNVLPNDATLASVLSTCSKLGALGTGRRVHAYAETTGFNGNVYVSNGLIDMYAKCGCIDFSMHIFHGMNIRDVITWNSMIAGLAMHGRGFEALELFQAMKDAGVIPDGITFVGVLSACGHVGLVDLGFAYFKSMVDDYSLAPWIEHYGCMIDLLGRAGLVQEALDLVQEMPMQPDSVIWSSILGVCQVYCTTSLAEFILGKLVKLEPMDVTNYVVLSNIYGFDGRWSDVARLKRMARGVSLGKLPGQSLIEVNSRVVNFCSCDSSHPLIHEIYGALQGLRSVYMYSKDEIRLDAFCCEAVIRE